MTDLREALAQLADGVETVLSEPPFDALISTGHLSYRLKVAREALAAVPVEPERNDERDQIGVCEHCDHVVARGGERIQTRHAVACSHLHIRAYVPARPVEPEAWEWGMGVKLRPDSQPAFYSAWALDHAENEAENHRRIGRDAWVARRRPGTAPGEWERVDPEWLPDNDDDPFTAAARLCDDDGIVRKGLMHHGTNYTCTGHAHFAGEHYRCLSPAHGGFPGPLLDALAPGKFGPREPRVDPEPRPIRCATRCSQYPDCQHDWSEWEKRDPEPPLQDGGE